MDKAVFSVKDFTFTIEANQRDRHMKLTLQYKGTKQVDELNSVKHYEITDWIIQRLDEFFDFYYHTSCMRNPTHEKKFYGREHGELMRYKNMLRRAIFMDDEVDMIINLSEALADFLDEEDARAMEETETEEYING